MYIYIYIYRFLSLKYLQCSMYEIQEQYDDIFQVYNKLINKNSRLRVSRCLLSRESVSND